jgi:hypothetical protein
VAAPTPSVGWRRRFSGRDDCSIADDRFEPFIDAPTKFGEGPLESAEAAGRHSSARSMRDLSVVRLYRLARSTRARPNEVDPYPELRK